MAAAAAAAALRTEPHWRYELCKGRGGEGKGDFGNGTGISAGPSLWTGISPFPGDRWMALAWCGRPLAHYLLSMVRCEWFRARVFASAFFVHHTTKCNASLGLLFHCACSLWRGLDATRLCSVLAAMKQEENSHTEGKKPCCASIKNTEPTPPSITSLFIPPSTT